MEPNNDIKLGAMPAVAGKELATPVVAPALDPAYVAKATRAAVEFESFFIEQMLKDMRSTTRELASEDSPFNDKVNHDMQNMADGLLSKQMAGQRAFGVADAILRQLVPNQPIPFKNDKT